MIGFRPSADSLAPLLRLLDDDTPEVRQSIADALDTFDGDVSELIGETPVNLGESERLTLSNMLLPARRARLRRDWIVPAGGAARFGDDWDGLEALLRMLSDYLHDGVTLRLSLADALDLLAEETEESFFRDGPSGLVDFLLKSRRLQIDREIDLQPCHYDLAGVMAGDPANAVGVGMVLLLVARRHGADISGINLPGTFLCRMEEVGGPVIIDPAARGRILGAQDLAYRIRNYPREVRLIASRPATPGELLLRLTEDLASAFAVHELDEDALLMEELLASLLPA